MPFPSISLFFEHTVLSRLNLKFFTLLSFDLIRQYVSPSLITNHPFSKYHTETGCISSFMRVQMRWAENCAQKRATSPSSSVNYALRYETYDGKIGRCKLIMSSQLFSSLNLSDKQTWIALAERRVVATIELKGDAFLNSCLLLRLFCPANRWLVSVTQSPAFHKEH